MKTKIIIIGLILMAGMTSAETYSSLQAPQYQYTLTGLNITYGNDSVFLPYQIGDYTFQYSYGNNMVSWTAAINSSKIEKKTDATIQFADLSGKSWIIHTENISSYWINKNTTTSANGTITTENKIPIDNTKFSLSFKNKKVEITTKLKDKDFKSGKGIIPEGIIYFESHSYVINVSNGNATLQSATGGYQWDYCLQSVAPKINSTYGENLTMFQSMDCSSAVDFIGKKNGTVSGATWNATGGKYGGAFTFDGTDDYINVDDDSTLDIQNAITIEAWIKPTSMGVNTPEMITAKEGAYTYAAMDGGNYVYWYLDSAGADYSKNWHVAITTDLYNGSWHHIAFTFDKDGGAGNQKIYIDGGAEIKTRNSNSNAIATTSNPLTIGYAVTVAAYPYKGLIDEVRIYNRSLSAGEINASYQSRKAIFQTGNATYANVSIPAGETCANITLTTAPYYGGNLTLWADGVELGTIDIAANTSGMYDCSDDGIRANFNLTISNVVGADSTPEFVKVVVETKSLPTFSIALNAPINQTTTNDNTTDFNFTVSGTEAEYNCTLYLNDTDKGNNATVSNNTATIITSSEVTDGSYTWYVNCTSGGVTNSSEARTITIDTTVPVIYFNPATTANGAYIQNWIYIEVTASDTNIDTVLLEWNGVNESFDNNLADTYWENKTPLGSGAYTFKAYANDTGGNTNSTELKNVTLELPLCEVYVMDVNGAPVENATVEFWNITNNTLIKSGLTDSAGYISLNTTYDCNGISIITTYPDAGFTAQLLNTTLSSNVYINDYVAASLQLKNTLGQALPYQDCQVAAYKANTSEMVHDYNTRCGQMISFVDKNGAWKSIPNCTYLSDSLGHYYFVGSTSEDIYNFKDNYDLGITCNGQTINLPFSPDAVKHPDVSGKWLDDLTKNAGLWIIIILSAILLAWLALR